MVVSQSSCVKCGAVVVDPTKHEEWHHYHQQQLVRMVDQIERQQKVTGKLIVRFSSVLNRGGADGGITVDLLAFATYWIGAGVAIGVLAWSVSERRWLPAGAMLLFALLAMFLAYREIRPSNRRKEPSAARAPEQRAAAPHSPAPHQQQPPHHQQQPPHQQQQPPQQQHPQHQHPQHQEQQYQQQHAAGPARQAYPTTTQPAAVPSPQPQYPLPSYNSKSPNGQAPPDNTQNGWNRRGQDWR
jgi:flagellar biosynthesis/type III secretory pathway M-ring protein FliF/YscJ